MNTVIKPTSFVASYASRDAAEMFIANRRGDGCIVQHSVAEHDGKFVVREHRMKWIGKFATREAADASRPGIEKQTGIEREVIEREGAFTLHDPLYDGPGSLTALLAEKQRRGSRS